VSILSLNLLLAVIWSFAWGEISPSVFTVGFLLAYGVLFLFRPVLPASRYFRKLPQLIRLTGFVLYELVLSSLRIAWDVVTPAAFRHPGIVAVPLEAESDLEIALVANLVTLTPGTLSLEVGADPRVLFVHSMFAENPEEVRSVIKRRIEAPVLELVR
jgi:multicomponent Na+:H+ antiporter subunit E